LIISVCPEILFVIARSPCLPAGRRRATWRSQEINGLHEIASSLTLLAMTKSGISGQELIKGKQMVRISIMKIKLLRNDTCCPIFGLM
jgi:hypothetical protein